MCHLVVKALDVSSVMEFSHITAIINRRNKLQEFTFGAVLSKSANRSFKNKHKVACSRIYAVSCVDYLI